MRQCSNNLGKVVIAGLQINEKLGLKMFIFSYPSVETFVLGAQKNSLIEAVLLSTHNIIFFEK